MMKYHSKKTLIIANGEPPSRALLCQLIQENTLCIAVDGGLLSLDRYQLTPDLITGDFDSLPKQLLQKYAHVQQIYTPDQSQTDLEKALALVEGQITVCGALGKRMDHTMTNICLLCRNPGKVKFETDTQIVFAIPKRIELSCQPGQTLSLIPIASEVTNVTTSGLKWELKNTDLNKNFVSISNICTQHSITISYTTGNLVVCLAKV